MRWLFMAFVLGGCTLLFEEEEAIEEPIAFGEPLTAEQDRNVLMGYAIEDENPAVVFAVVATVGPDSASVRTNGPVLTPIASEDNLSLNLSIYEVGKQFSVSTGDDRALVGAISLLDVGSPTVAEDRSDSGGCSGVMPLEFAEQGLLFGAAIQGTAAAQLDAVVPTRRLFRDEIMGLDGFKFIGLTNDGSALSYECDVGISAVAGVRITID